VDIISAARTAAHRIGVSVEVWVDREARQDAVRMAAVSFVIG
jgi:hypothetical protein